MDELHQNLISNNNSSSDHAMVVRNKKKEGQKATCKEDFENGKSKPRSKTPSKKYLIGHAARKIMWRKIARKKQEEENYWAK